jgi:hypothetical protein
MSQDDDTPRWTAGFKDAVKGLLGPTAGGWGPTYSDAGSVAQAIQRAYQAGRLDGMAEALKVSVPTQEPPDERFETVEEAWERLGLFEPPERLPEPWVVTLEPLDGDHYVWCVRSVRSVLGLSLADAEDYVKELLDD